MTIEMDDITKNVAGDGSKKSKRDKKKKEKTKGPDGIIVVNGGSTDVVEQTLKEKKEKKDKNKKRKKVSTSAAEEKVEETSVDEMVVDQSELSQPKAEKAKKRKRETGREAAEAEDGGEPPADSSEKKKRKKKRKSEPSEEVTDSVPIPTAESPSLMQEESNLTSKKDRKSSKREKTSSQTEASSSSSLATTTTVNTTTSTIPTSATPPPSSAPSPDEAAAFLTKNAITIHSNNPLTPILSFGQLDIPERLRSAFKGFKEPTPIQACAWPHALAGQDVVGIAETGSGKTLAFGIPGLARIISTIYSHTKPVALVLAPTRELAIQTHDTVNALGGVFNIRSVAVFGGVDKTGQIKALQQDFKQKKKSKGGENGSYGTATTITRIVVGTPGRILDLINDHVLDLSEVHYLVLDEADRMLDKGFENDIRSIIGYTKQGGDRQTLMFSATWPEAVRRLASTFQRNPVRVTVGSDDLTANSKVEQMLEVFDDARSKDSRLLGHLKFLLPKKNPLNSPDTARILIFALYKKEAARVEIFLRSKGYSVIGLHGDMNQNARMDALQKFKTGETPLLVATDVAARGLDIPNVAAVVNYTFPLTIEDYIHRIGRTGRGGKSGKSLTYFTGDNHERSLAGELARVLRESGFESQTEGLKKFPMTIKKKTHSAYGAFFRNDIPAPSQPTKIVFD